MHNIQWLLRMLLLSIALGRHCRDGLVAHAQAILLASGCVRASRLRNTRNNARLLQAAFSCSLKHQHMMRTRVMYGNGELI